MRYNSTGSMLFNASGVAVLLMVVGYIGSGFFSHEHVEPCSGRYPAGKQFALDNERGQILTPMEIQARVGSREWGLLKNAVVVGVDGKGQDASLKIVLEPVDDENNPGRNGAGFLWQTPELTEAKSVCLSYRARLSQDFDFEHAGRLPGIYTALTPSDLDGALPGDSFIVRPTWLGLGAVGVEVRTSEGASWSESKNTWPRDRWVRIEEEVILNSAGKNNGLVRLWADGQMLAQRGDLVLWNEERRGFSGVVSDVGYAKASGSSEVQITPFVVQWHK